MSTAPDAGMDIPDRDAALAGCLARFQLAWLGGENPKLETYLDEVPPDDRNALFRRLLSLEYELRLSHGESPETHDYSTRFPLETETIATFFGGILRESLPTHQGLERPAREGFRPQGPLRFRTIRPHARGGLGVVMVAFDQELSREVALKEIQDQFADDPTSRARFLREAEITGSLEHPSIVPIYGMGRYSDGRPYYAMRFVKGDSLREAITSFHESAPSLDSTEHDLRLRGLLDRFIDLCNAIAYAHSRGILHRDLKPANVLLGPFGETLVVDWGLAKPVGASEEFNNHLVPKPASSDESTLTQTGSALGTPAYMSPEQASGAVSSLRPASDIYGLGATLFCLLTGRPPFERAEIKETLGRVSRGDFPPPRKLNSRISPALEAICLKAMALKPSDRYDSARALADDLERWLGDSPVSCHRDPIVALLARWSRKHRVAVVASIALLLTTVTALAISTVLIGREQARTRSQRDLALENHHQARLAVDDLTRVAENKLLNVPGLQPLRKELLTTALAYYRRMSSQKSNDPTVRAELISAQIRAASITTLVGSKEDAVPLYREAIELAERLVASHPTTESRRDLAIAYNNLAMVEFELGRHEDSFRSINKAMELRQQLSREFPNDDAITRELGAGYNNLAIQESRAGRMEDSVRDLRRSIELRKQLIARRPNDPLFQSNLADALFNLANRLRDLDHKDESIAVAEEGLGIRTKLVGNHPEVIQYREELAIGNFNLGLIFRSFSTPAKALEYLQKARAIQEAFVAQNPEVVLYRGSLANTVYSMAALMEDAKRMDESLDLFRQARTIQEMNVRLHPESVEPRYDLGWYCVRAGKAMLRANRFHDSVDFYSTACAAFEIVVRQDAKNRERRIEYSEALDGLGVALFQEEKDADATRAFLHAIDVEKAVLDHATASSSDRKRIGVLYSHLVDSQKALGQFGAASATAHERLQWLSNDPNDLYDAARDLARSDPGSKDAELVIRTLKKAIAAGFRDQSRLGSDRSFQSLQNRPEFASIFADLGFPVDPFRRP